MAENGRPEPEDIQEDLRGLEEVWMGGHANWREVDSFTNGKYGIWGAAQQEISPRPTHRTNRGRTIIDRTSDNLLPYKPVFKRDRIGDAEDADENTSAIEHALDAWWADSSLKELSLPLKTLGRYLLKYNYGILEGGFDISQMPEKPEQGDPALEAKMREWEERRWNFNPFFVRAPHPTQVLLPPFDRQPEVAIKLQRWHKKALMQELERQKRIKAEGDSTIEFVGDFDIGNNRFSLVNLHQHFTKEWITWLVSHEHSSSPGEVVFQQQNPYNLVPFAHAFGGFKDEESGQDGGNPEHLAQGFLWSVLELLRQYDQVRGAKLELYMKAAFSPMVTPNDATELAEMLSAGTNIVGQTKLQEIGFLPIPQLPQFLADLEDRIDREIVEATVPRAAFGGRDVGVDTVGQHAMLIQVSAKRLLETMEQMAFMASEISVMFLRMFASWGQPITVRGKSLRSSQLQENYHVVASFPVLDEAVRHQRKQQGMAEVQAGLKSRRRYWEEDDRLQDPSGEEDQLLTETVKFDPAVQQVMARKKAQELGMLELFDEAQQLMAGGGGGAPAGNGAAPQPLGPEDAGSEAEQIADFAVDNQLVRPPRVQPGTPL